MAIERIGIETDAGISSSFDVPTVAGMAVGDLIVVALGAGGVETFSTVGPAGFTQVFDYGFTGDLDQNAFIDTYWVGYKYADADDVAATGFSFSAGDTLYYVAATAVYRGVVTGSPFGDGAPFWAIADLSAVSTITAPGAGASCGAAGATVMRVFLSDIALTGLSGSTIANIAAVDGEHGAFIVTEDAQSGAQDPLTGATGTGGGSGGGWCFSLPLEPVADACPVDITAPTITNLDPAPGVGVRARTVISFDIADETSLALVVLIASFSDGTVEVIHDGTNFRGAYLGAANTRTAISGGYHFTVLRDGGWTRSPTIEYLPIDHGGNVGEVS